MIRGCLPSIPDNPPAGLRAPRGHILVRISRPAANVTLHPHGWQTMPRATARSLAAWCERNCHPEGRSSTWPRGWRHAAAALGRQIRARLTNGA